MEQYRLPDGWVWTTVGEIYKIIGGGTPSTKIEEYWQGNIPWITSADVHGLKDIRPRKTISEKAIKNSATNLVPTGSLIVVTRVGLGKVALTDKPLCFSQDSHALVGNKEVVFPEYSLYFLSQAVRAFKYHSRGTTINGVTKKQLADLPCPLPPLPEQQRIVAKLEALLGEARTARQALERIPPLLARFRQAVLAAAFRGELTGDSTTAPPMSPPQAGGIKGGMETPLTGGGLPEGWVWKTIGQVFKVNLGGTPSRKNPGYWNGDIPWVSSGEVAFCRIRDTREKITAEGLAHSNAKLDPPGTVLLAMIGEGKTRGQAAILDVAAATNQNVASILCSDTSIPPEWVFWWLMYHYEETRGGGSGGAQPALNAERVRQLPIPLAPLVEQHRIVARIEALFARAGAVESAASVVLGRLPVVEQSILARAFRGELVPQGPEDEPASALLQRVREERGRT